MSLSWIERPGRPPIGLRWRSSYKFITSVVGVGIATDQLAYSVIIPIMPFHLQELGYPNLSSLTGWLLFSYSAGLVLSTIPIALLSERYNARKTPLIVGLIVLIGSEIMLMRAPMYVVMCIARALQGIGSSMVWVVGLALVCDSTPKKYIGAQLGMAILGTSVGAILGPPIAGELYSRFGFSAPFRFAMAATIFDLIGRFLIIERKEALRWDFDPAALPESDGTETNKNSLSTDTIDQEANKSSSELSENKADDVSASFLAPLSLVTVLIKLLKSSRALTSIIITLIHGIAYSSQEPTIPLQMQSRWGLDPTTVGLVFLAAVVPTIISSPLSGFCADKIGPEWVIFVSLALSLPWWVMLVIQGPLAFFIVAFALQSLFSSGVLSPLMAELATVSQSTEGIGYAHVYGAFNLVYGIGTSVGPILGGQIYDHVKHGWTAICLIAAGFVSTSMVFSFLYIGNDPLAHRLKRVLNNRIKWTSSTRGKTLEMELVVEDLPKIPLATYFAKRTCDG